MAGAAFFVAATLSAYASAAPKWLRLSIVNEPSTAMTVTWHTVEPATSQVQFGTDTAKLDKAAVGTSKLGSGSFGYIHEAEMAQLQPDTKYFYRVGDATDGWSSVFSFRTAPAYKQDCGKFRFIFLGDNRPDSILGMGDNWQSIFQEAIDEAPAFVLSGGDLVYDGKENGEWIDFLDWTGEPARYAPFMPAMGNHDDDTVVGDAAQYNQLFALPRSSGTGSSGTEDYYYFTYANAIVVSLNTQQFKGGSVPFGDQAAWLDEVLTNNPRRWKFVLLHHPIYTSDTMLSHPPNEQNQNATLVPVFDKHHVDFVLQSHNHWYERFEPSNCALKGTPGSKTICSTGATGFDTGTVHLTSGGAGALTLLYCGSAPKVCKTDHHYVMFDIDGDSIDMQTWASSQQTWSTSSGNHKLIDQLQFSKSGGVCPSPDAGVPDAAPDAPPDQQGPDATGDGPQEAAADAAPAPDASVDAGQPKPDGPGPSHPDVASNDEPQPATLDNPPEEAVGDAGGCACGQAASGVRSWHWLAAMAAAAAIATRRSRRRR
jgi:hypothetical protein